LEQGFPVKVSPGFRFGADDEVDGMGYIGCILLNLMDESSMDCEPVIVLIVGEGHADVAEVSRLAQYPFFFQ
jgi:hypothetical protein